MDKIQLAKRISALIFSSVFSTQLTDLLNEKPSYIAKLKPVFVFLIEHCEACGIDRMTFLEFISGFIKMPQHKTIRKVMLQASLEAIAMTDEPLDSALIKKGTLLVKSHFPLADEIITEEINKVIPTT